MQILLLRPEFGRNLYKAIVNRIRGKVFCKPCANHMRLTLRPPKYGEAALAERSPRRKAKREVVGANPTFSPKILGECQVGLHQFAY